MISSLLVKKHVIFQTNDDHDCDDDCDDDYDDDDDHNDDIYPASKFCQELSRSVLGYQLWFGLGNRKTPKTRMDRMSAQDYLNAKILHPFADQ